MVMSHMEETRSYEDTYFQKPEVEFMQEDKI